MFTTRYSWNTANVGVKHQSINQSLWFHSSSHCVLLKIQNNNPCLLIRATSNVDFVVMLCLYRNGQLFEYNHFKIICHYCFHINSSFVLSYYNTTQNMYLPYFFINKILDPITSDVVNNVTPSMWRYAPNTRN